MIAVVRLSDQAWRDSYRIAAYMKLQGYTIYPVNPTIESALGVPSYPEGATRGNSKNKDGYFYIAATFRLRFYFDKYKQIAGLPGSKRSKKVGCPANRF